MKILTKQKQREIERYIVANLIIANDMSKDSFSVDIVNRYVNNAWNALNLVGGAEATHRASNTIRQYLSWIEDTE